MRYKPAMPDAYAEQRARIHESIADAVPLTRLADACGASRRRRTRMGNAWADSAATARGADRIRALGDIGADAHREPQAGDDSRLRRVPGRALSPALSGYWRAGSR